MPTRKLPPRLALLLLLVLTSRVAAEESLPEVVRRVKPSVVSIITYNSRGEVLLTGSGFFFRPGQVLTNLHVMEGAHHAEVRAFEGKGKTYRVGGVVVLDEEGDLVVLSVDMPPGRLPAAEVSAALPEEGERVFVIGNPLRLEGSVSDGIVSAVREVPSLGKIIQLTAPVSRGSSGSPVFNMRGQVIGVITIKVTNGQNINLAMSASRISALTGADKPLSFDQLAARARSVQQPNAVSEWWYRNGLDSLWLGNYESALDYFEKAVNRNPKRAETWIQVGFCKVKQGKNHDAIRAFEQALKLEPDSYEALNKLGDAYYYAANYHKARESYERAVRLRPDLAEGHYNLGLAYFELGDRASAHVQARVLKPLDEALHQKLLREIEK